MCWCRFARDAATLRDVGLVLLPPCEPGDESPVPLTRWLVAGDVFESVPTAVGTSIYTALSAKFESVTSVLGNPDQILLLQVMSFVLADIYRLGQAEKYCLSNYFFRVKVSRHFT